MLFIPEDNLAASCISHDYKASFRWECNVLLPATEGEHKNAKNFSKLFKVFPNKAFAVEAQSIDPPNHQDLCGINMLKKGQNCVK